MSKQRKLVDKSVFREDLGLTAIQSIEAVDMIKDYIFEGKSKSFIHNQIKEVYKVSESSISKLIDSTYRFIETYALDTFDFQSLIDVHIGFYEKLYEWFDSIDHFEGKRKTLFAKERLLGLHQQNNTLIINQENILEVQVQSDFDRLNPEEKKRLNFLIEKTNVPNRD